MEAQRNEAVQRDQPQAIEQAQQLHTADGNEALVEHVEPRQHQRQRHRAEHPACRCVAIIVEPVNDGAAEYQQGAGRDEADDVQRPADAVDRGLKVLGSVSMHFTQGRERNLPHHLVDGYMQCTDQHHGDRVRPQGLGVKEAAEQQHVAAIEQKGESRRQKHPLAEVKNLMKDRPVPLELVRRAFQPQVRQRCPDEAAEDPAARERPDRRIDQRPGDLEPGGGQLAQQFDLRQGCHCQMPAGIPDLGGLEPRDQRKQRDDGHEFGHEGFGVDGMRREPSGRRCQLQHRRRRQGADRHHKTARNLHHPADIQKTGVVAARASNRACAQSEIGKHRQPGHDGVAHRHHTVELGCEQSGQDEAARETNDLAEHVPECHPAGGLQEALFQPGFHGER